MRLIDADLLINKLKGGLTTPNYHPDLGDAFQCMEAEERNEDIICMMETVQAQPTAYDVDKVVERLDKEPSCGFGFKGLYTKKAIEIVKGAVKDE